MKYFFSIIFLLIGFSALANVIDNSANQPSFPPGGYSLLATVVSSPARQNISVQNQSADAIQIWRDQNCSGTGLSMIVLAAASVAGGQGGSWSSNSFKSCIRVYGPSSGDQVMIYQN